LPLYLTPQKPDSDVHNTTPRQLIYKANGHVKAPPPHAPTAPPPAPPPPSTATATATSTATATPARAKLVAGRAVVLRLRSRKRTRTKLFQSMVEVTLRRTKKIRGFEIGFWKVTFKRECFDLHGVRWFFGSWDCRGRGLLNKRGVGGGDSWEMLLCYTALRYTALRYATLSCCGTPL